MLGDWEVLVNEQPQNQDGSECVVLSESGTPSGGGFSPLPTTSGSSFSANQSPLPYKDQINHRANYGEKNNVDFGYLKS
ncbi:hypothetical protein Y032_0068g202 [Ancylostoma ceylanicum]|uniref:Uncharacterized protein n=1 Tax=Ancylostoma ceylanicum TaxID=53326 RepID=A0A016TYQ1_9BILA|nr:hypothetical protein Y032_0068g202 [Ancylostoma ceylanicum]